MVAIFTGVGTGFERGSGSVLGAQGLLGSASHGRGGENVFINAATGNLLLNRQDEFLAGRGPDIAIGRTYNSLAALGDDNNDKWRQSTDRRVFGLSGTLNAVGSSVHRVSGDGTDIVYSWDAGRGAYVSTDGAGSYDAIVKSGATWVWTDGDSRTVEKYDDNNGGRITEESDVDGNKLIFSYLGDKLDKVTTADGAWTQYSWSGYDITKIVTGYTDLATGTAKTLTRTWYEYSAGRLAKVRTDLTPNDNSAPSDADSYWISYGYDGSGRVNSIQQKDGSNLAITYDGSGRVATFTETASAGVTRVTTLAYYSGYTTITDPLGQVTRLDIAANGNLTKVTAPPAYTGAAQQIVQFGYNASGDLTSVTDPNGQSSTYGYDGNGNILTATDRLGNVITRTYSATNRLLTETRVGSDTTGAAVSHTLRYAYDAEDHLRYAVSAEGFVTEYRYTAAGDLEYFIEYPEQTYPAGAGAISESGLNGWRDSIADRSSTKIQYTSYDARGNLTATLNYGAATSAGAASTAEGYSRTYYTYDQAGRLLSLNAEGRNAETFVYDGTGRLTAKTDVNGGTTTFVFNDASTTTTVTLASGYVTTSVYNLAGDLVSQTDGGSYVASGTSTYKYDKLGRVRMSTDGTGFNNYFLYDKAGRKIADVNHYGDVVEYLYDAAGRLAATARYANRLTAAQLTTLSDPNGLVEIAAIRPAAHSYDVWNFSAYDKEGRVVEAIGGDGSVTAYAYDGAGQLVATTSYYNKLSAAQVNGFKSSLPATSVLPAADGARDSIARDFYDADGRLVGRLDGEGYLRRAMFDKAGQKVEEVAFAAATSAGLRASGTFAQLLASVGSSANDRHTRYVYDGQGLLRYTIDSLNQVISSTYDAAGQVTSSTHFAAAMSATSDYTYDNVKALVAPLVSNGSNRTSWIVYDGAGRVAYSINADGGVTGNSYDSAGNLTRSVAFATKLATSSLPSLATMNGWQASNIGNAANRIARNWYTARGEARFSVDAEGFVSRNDYDAEGRLVASYLWDSRVTVSDSTTIDQVNTATGGAGGYTGHSYAYRADGRLFAEYDGLGTPTVYDYYATGLLAARYDAYGTSDQAVTLYVYDSIGQLTAQYGAWGNPEQNVVQYGYDGLGNRVTVTDARGKVATYAYDRIGQTTSVTNAIGGVTYFEYTAFGEIWKTTDAKGAAGHAWYDGLGRLTAVRDAEDNLTETSFTVFGEISSVTQRYNKVTGTAAIGTRPSVAANASEDATASFTYDKLSRQLTAVDAMGVTESYAYDALGNRTSVTNRLGAVTTYTYDRRGAMLTETLPQVTHDSAGNVTSTTVVSRFEYDARGNRTKTVEADNLSYRRTTLYFYDRADQMIERRRDAATVIADDLVSTSSVTPSDRVKYDLRGNVIETIDAGGGRVLTYYDDLNRKVVEINPVGAYSAWSYDATGNVIAARTYATLVSLPGSAGGTPPAAPGGAYRETSYGYDNIDRMTSTTVANVTSGVWNGSSYVLTTGSVTNTMTLDAVGNVIAATDANGAQLFYWYDKLGREIARVDAEGYLTTRALDPDGNVVTERRYATRFTGTPNPLAAPPAVATSSDDRVASFTYDRNGRRLTESRSGVIAYTVAGVALVGAPSTATVSYVYNGLGEVTRNTKSTRDNTDYAYDGTGRLSTETRSAFVDFNGNAVSPTTDYYYDGFAGLVRTRQRGASGAAERVTTYSYGANGWLASMTDASGFTRTFAYDALGRLKKESYSRIRSDGSTVVDAIATRYDLLGRSVYRGVATQSGGSFTTLDYNQTEFNAFGEVSRQGSNGLWQVENKYDNVGRLFATNAGDGVWKYFGYDKAGNQTIGVASAGYDLPSTLTLADAVALVSRGDVNGSYTVYDKRGLATQVYEEGRQLSASATQNLVTSRGYNAFREVASETNALGATINYTYNTLGRRVRTESPYVSITLENGTAQTVRPTENYYFDLSGRLIGARDANGNLTTRTLLAGTGYGTAEAIVAVQYYADGGVTTARYDVHGDARTLIDQVGRVTSQTFDAMGRVTQVGHPGGLVETYAYDGLGQRIQGWNNVFQVPVYGPPEDVWVEDPPYWDDYWQGWVYPGGHWETQTPIIAYAPEKSTTDYDALGRVTREVAFGGDATTTSYGWNAGLTTTGLATYGGWVKTTTYANGKVLTVSADIYNRELSRTDLGGHVFASTYDKAGRLTVRGDQNYNYYNTGLVAEAYTLTGDVPSQNWTRRSTKYGYDAVGNRLTEYTLEEGETAYIYYYDDWGNYDWYYSSFSNVYQNSSATYDSLGRLTSFAEAGGIKLPAASILYRYDANGNIRATTATYHPLDAQGAAYSWTTTQDYWYRYDALNRMTTSKGQLSGGQIVRGATGVDIQYNFAGQRTRATTSVGMYASVWDPNYYYQDPYDPYYGGYYGGYVDVYYTGARQEDYTYNAAGSLQNVYIGESSYIDNGDTTITVVDPSGLGALRGTYTYDLLGRVTRQLEYSYGTTVAYDRSVSYDNAGHVTLDDTYTRQGGDVIRAYTSYYYGYGSNYALGSVVSSYTSNYKNGGYQNGSSTTNNYVWWGGATQSTQVNTSGSTTHTTYYYYDTNGTLASAYVADGRPRSISYTANADGQVIRRDEYDNNYNTYSGGDPHEVWYRFGGRQLGYVGNNGTLDTDYATSISNRQIPSSGNGAFRNNSSYGASYADFDQSYDPINSYAQSSGGGGSYTVRAGDDLAHIAQSVWGDSSLWYKIAEANGLSGSTTLAEGQSLIIPSGVLRAQNNATTYRPYDPAKALGDTSPTTPQPQSSSKKHGCGVLGQIILAVIAVVVTVVLPIAAPATFGGVMGGIGAAVIGNVVSQAVGLATGIQDKFSWKGVALAAISAGVSGGIGADGLDLFGKIGSKVVQGAVSGVVSSAITQGIAVATGLQDKFDWAGVAAAGVGGAIGAFVSDKTQGLGKYGSRIAATGASALAQAATRTAIEGSSFGDNLVAALPSAVAQVAGGVVDIALGGPEVRAELAAQKAAKALMADTSQRLMDGACFVAGTMVWTPGGPVAIEQVKVGDWVFARHEGGASEDIHRRQVTRTFEHHGKRTITIVLETEGRTTQVTATAEHPFWVSGSGWVHSTDIRPGDEILRMDGSRARVVELGPDEAAATVYNFTVDVDHTYFVGEFGLWVHNDYTTNDGRVIHTSSGKLEGTGQNLGQRRIPWGILPKGSDADSITFWKFDNGYAYKIMVGGEPHFFDPRLFTQRVADNIRDLETKGGEVTPELIRQMEFANRVETSIGNGRSVYNTGNYQPGQTIAPANAAPSAQISPSPLTAPTLDTITPPGAITTTLPPLPQSISGAGVGGFKGGGAVLDWRYPAMDVSRTPAQGPRGSWSGERGNSTWRPSDPALGPIEYRGNYANMTPYAVRRVRVPGMDGLPGGGDRALAFEKMGMTWEEGVRWQRQNGLIAHHEPSGRYMEFVPENIHAFNHYGGAYQLRNTTPGQRLAIRGIGITGRALGVAGMAYGAYQDGTSLYNEFQISRATGDYSNTAWEGARIATAWTTAAAGAEMGAQIGAWGFAAGPVVGAVTTLLGGIIGGAVGYWVGSEAVNGLH